MKWPPSNVAASVKQRLLNQAKQRGDFEAAHAESLVREIINTVVETDGVEFDESSVIVKPIREPDEYRGVRVHLNASLESVRIPIHLDIGLGDVVTPPAAIATIPSILRNTSQPRVRVYPPETIIAEKLQAMVKLGIANSRMKDFFDVYVLAQNREFDQELLAGRLASSSVDFCCRSSIGHSVCDPPHPPSRPVPR